MITYLHETRFFATSLETESALPTTPEATARGGREGTWLAFGTPAASRIVVFLYAAQAYRSTTAPAESVTAVTLPRLLWQ